MIQTDNAREPRWPALLSLVAAGGLYAALPRSLSVGPRWLLLVTMICLTIPSFALHMRAKYRSSQLLGYVTSAVVTAAMIISLFLLVSALPAKKEEPIILLRSAMCLWFTNIIVFATWYWRLDAGGPHGRDSEVGHRAGAFLFPQMAMPSELRQKMGNENWSPTFLDYLFLAFNTSTALSPADTAVLSRWAKCLMMVQAIVSLTIIVLLAARAINIL